MGGLSIKGTKMRYFHVGVNHYAVTITEVFTAPKRYDWIAVIDGVQVQYTVEKLPKGIVKAWFERGITEVQCHAKNLSQTGFVLWSKRSPKPRQTSKKEAVVRAKMEKLL